MKNKMREWGFPIVLIVSWMFTGAYTAAHLVEAVLVLGGGVQAERLAPVPLLEPTLLCQAPELQTVDGEQAIAWQGTDDGVAHAGGGIGKEVALRIAKIEVFNCMQQAEIALLNEI